MSKLYNNNESDFNWKLKRLNDGLTKVSKDIKWIEFDKNGRFKKDYKKIKIGRSLLMSPFNIFFTWQTTTVTKVEKEEKNYIKFKTKNSDYELFKL